MDLDLSAVNYLAVAATTGTDMAQARQRVYANIPRIGFQGCHYRQDIALREISTS